VNLKRLSDGFCQVRDDEIIPQIGEPRTWLTDIHWTGSKQLRTCTINTLIAVSHAADIPFHTFLLAEFWGTIFFTEILNICHLVEGVTAQLANMMYLWTSVIDLDRFLTVNHVPFSSLSQNQSTQKSSLKPAHNFLSIRTDKPTHWLDRVTSPWQN